MPVNGKAALAVGLGGLLVWSGVRGWSVLATLGDLLKGSQPNTSSVNPLMSESSFQVSSTFAGGGGAGIAETALRYQGHAYRFGGAPGKNGEKPWDCSSFVNFVVGIERGMAIPGYAAGRYDGSSHGPTTAQWAVWNGTQSIRRDEVDAGDIIVWVGHMGIAISNDQMVSALNPKTTTKIGSIDGFKGVPVRYGRFI